MIFIRSALAAASDLTDKWKFHCLNSTVDVFLNDLNDERGASLINRERLALNLSLFDPKAWHNLLKLKLHGPVLKFSLSSSPNLSSDQVKNGR